MIASGSRRFKSGLTRLVRAVSQTLAEKCGAFLIIELWSGEEDPDKDLATAKPAFRIILPSSGPLTGTAEALEKALRKIKLNKRSADVEVVYRKQGSPPGPGLLIPKREADRLNCFLMGLEIQPIYRSPVNGEVFPILLRKLHLGLSRIWPSPAIPYIPSSLAASIGTNFELKHTAKAEPELPTILNLALNTARNI